MLHSEEEDHLEEKKLNWKKGREGLPPHYDKLQSSFVRLFIKMMSSLCFSSHITKALIKYSDDIVCRGWEWQISNLLNQAQDCTCKINVWPTKWTLISSFFFFFCQITFPRWASACLVVCLDMSYYCTPQTPCTLLLLPWVMIFLLLETWLAVTWRLHGPVAPPSV